MKKAHRLLRGRYPLAILLAAGGAVAGAVAWIHGAAAEIRKRRDWCR